MNLKTTALCTMLATSLAMLAACGNNDSTAADDMVPPADTTAVDAMPADTMPADGMADTMPSDTMPSDTMPSDTMENADGTMGGDMMDGTMSFADMDKNADGGVTPDELAAGTMLHDHFAVADADGNGSLSDAEITKHRADMAAQPAR